MSGCSCQINMDVGGNGDALELLSEKQVTARKARRCGECDREIPPGEKYLRESYIYDGEFHHEQTCLDCISIRDHLFCDFYYGMVLEVLRTEILEYDLIPPESCIAKLTPRAREMVCEMIEEVWEKEEAVED